MEPARYERSLGELFADVSQNTATLMRQEMQRARTELMEKVSRVGRDTALAGAGGAVLYASLWVSWLLRRCCWSAWDGLPGLRRRSWHSSSRWSEACSSRHASTLFATGSSHQSIRSTH